MTETPQIKVTVIIPVYNVEKYLEECLDSVISQDLREIEILCINDGSTDSSGKILEKYSKKDDRFVIITKKNEGVAAARNQGIKEANGKYVMFMDPDDYYPEKDVLSSLFKAAKENDVFIAGGEFSFLKPDGSVEEAISFKDDPFLFGYYFEKEGVIKYEDYQFDYGYHRFIYDRNFIIDNDLLFPSLVRYQDPPFMVASLSKAEKFYALKKTVYRYRHEYKDIEWTKERVIDLIRGIKCSYSCACEHNYTALQTLCVKRLATEYGGIISQLDEDSTIKKILKEFSDKASFYENVIFENWSVFHNNPVELINKRNAFIFDHVPITTTGNIGMYYHHLTMGGIQKQMIRMARFLQEHGYKVTLIVDDNGEEIIGEAKDLETEFVPVVSQENSFSKRAKEFKAICNKRKISTVIYHAWLSEMLIWDMLYLQGLKVNVIVQMHLVFTAPLLDRNPYFFDLPKLIRYADAVVCLNEIDEKYWSRFNQRVYRIPNLLPREHQLSRNNSNAHNLIWIGRFAHEKRPQDAILILSEVKKKVKDITLFMVGDDFTGVLTDECHRLAKKLHVEDAVKFCGFVSDVDEIYKQAYINLSTSEYEGYGLTYAETMAYGIPTVAYRMDYLDLQKDKYGMSIVEQGDILSAAQKCVDLCVEPHLWKKRSMEAIDGFKELKSFDYYNTWQEVFDFDKRPNCIDDKAIMKMLNEYGRLSVNKANRQIEMLQNDFTRVNNSFSYRLGLFITYLPRRLYHMIKNYEKE